MRNNVSGPSRSSASVYPTLPVLVLLSLLALVGCENGPFSPQSGDSAGTGTGTAVEITPDDPFFLDGSQWYLDTINAVGAWQLAAGVEFSGSRLVPARVAVIDSPIDEQHEDLREVMTGEGAVFLTNSTEADRLPGAHGTHVAGLVGARGGNGIGIAGAGYNGFSGSTVPVPIMPIAALPSDDEKGGFLSDVMNAVLYAAGLENTSGSVPDQPARVINMSLGAPSDLEENARSAFHDVIKLAAAQDVVLVAAAGNAGSPALDYPAAFPEVISVASVDQDLTRSSFSNHGPDLDLSAPGFEIVSAIPGNEYDFFSGTSMAAPLVAGVAALVRAVNPALSAPAVRGVLRTGARDLGEPGRDDQFGYGLLDAEAAVSRALEQRSDSREDSVLRGRSMLSPEDRIRDVFRTGAPREPARWDPAGSATIVVLVDPPRLAELGITDVAAYIQEHSGLEVYGGGVLFRGTPGADIEGDTLLRELFELDGVRSAVQDRSVILR